MKKLRRGMRPQACNWYMNSSLLFRSLRGLVIATLLCSLEPRPAFAQTKPEASPAAAGAPVRLDFDFPSKKTEPKGVEQIPLTAAVDLVLAEFRAAGLPVNAIFKNVESDYPAGQGISFVTIPPISLRQVTFEQAIQALAFAAKPAVTLQGDAKLVVIEREVVHPKLRVFNVSDFLLREGKELQNSRIKMLRNAITEGISLGQVPDPKLELDDNTGLLFATGSPEALEIVTEVARALCGPGKAFAPASTAPAPLTGTPASQTKP